MINCVNPRFIQHLDQYLQWLGESMRLIRELTVD